MVRGWRRGPGEHPHYAGLETTVDPGGERHVNEDNHTTLPYDYTPQYPVDLFADEQNIQPGEYEIDPGKRLHPSDSLSGNQAAERKGPGPDPKLFATAGTYHEPPPVQPRWEDQEDDEDGLTPRYAAPKSCRGEGPSARAEVYSLGVSLKEALARRRGDLADAAYAALVAVAARATEPLPSARWPSDDEFATALRRAAGLREAMSTTPRRGPCSASKGWPRSSSIPTLALGDGDVLAVDGPHGSGDPPLARRLAWTLGARGHRVAVVDAPEGGAAMREALDLELAPHRAGDAGAPGTPVFVVIDDADKADEATRGTLRAASERGARIVAVGAPATIAAVVGKKVAAFAVAELTGDAAIELVTRAIPSLPAPLRAHLVERAGGRPRRFRAAVHRLAGKAVVSREGIRAPRSRGATPRRRAFAARSKASTG